MTDPVAAAVARLGLSEALCAELIAAGIDLATITGEELTMVLCERNRIADRERRAGACRAARRDRRTGPQTA